MLIMTKRILLACMATVLAAISFNSCESLDPDKELSGTPYGFWVVDKLEVETSLTVNGNTTKNINTTDFSSEYCRLYLDTSHIATLWFNLEWPDSETFTYDETSRRMEFKKGLDKGDNGKAIVLLGVYDVELDGSSMVLRQPEASIGIGGYGASERATYYFHRAPSSEKPETDSN